MFERNNGIPTPVYYKLQSEIKDKIERGKWKSGSMIPPERIFVEEHGVSIGTVKKAITNLVIEGYLYRIQGKGTFVTDTQQRRSQLRYYRLLEDFSEVESNLEIKILEFKTVAGSQSINRRLKIRTSQDLFCIKRTLSSGQQPHIYSISYLPAMLFKGLDSIPGKSFESMTLYTFLDKQYNIPTIYNQELIGAVVADEEQAEILNVSRQTPLVYIEMISYTYRDKPYEYRISYCLTGTKKLFRQY